MPRKEKNRANDRKYHYTYLIRDFKNDKVYYGVHSTDHDPSNIEDYYSSSKHLKLIIEKEGFDKFTKEVRRFFSCRRDADKWEAKVLRRIGAKDHPSFYNKANGDSNFVTTGYVVVRIRGTENFTRVPVDDPYIGELYEYISSGREMSQAEKDNLSNFYKGKRSGKDNPVHKIKDRTSWVINVSKGSVGRKLPEHTLDKLRSPEHWKHLTDCRPSDDVQKAMNFRSSVNNNKNMGFWIYKGSVYLYRNDLPVHPNNNAVTYIKETHPLVDLLQAGTKRYPSIKEAAKDLGCHKNSLRNRVNSGSVAWEDYFWLEEEEVLQLKSESNKKFIKFITKKYHEEISENEKYEKPLSLGISDEDLTKQCMSTGNFLEGSTFKRSYVRDSQGYYTRYETTCPLCSCDKYVKGGVCSGIFEAGKRNLLAGYPACRCGDPKNFKIDIYLQEVKLRCELEGLQYLGVYGDHCGSKETKIEYLCRKGNRINTNRIYKFLAGTRCGCCRYENSELNIPKIDLAEEFAFRKELYKEKYEQ